MKKIPTILFLCVAMLFSVSSVLFAAGPSTSFVDFKAPHYDQSRLMFIIYGKSGYTSGINIFLNNVMVDMVKSDVKDIDDITDIHDIKLYEIGAPTSEVVKFWALLPHCEAIIYSIDADYNRTNQTISSDKKIKLRSRMLDVDGVGFDVSYYERELHIRKNVKVILRPEFFKSSDEAKKTADKTETKTNKNIEKPATETNNKTEKPESETKKNTSKQDK